MNWASPHLRFVDVDGDGLTDVLMSSDRGFDWVRGKGKDGFEPGGFTPYPNSEAEGPQVVFADSSHSIHLADMSGDGLQDIVRVQNGEVCYWPNLGYGRFGAKVTMERCPVFASLRDFDPRRVRLADIDGSGTADIIYLGKVNTIYRNEAGNGWSEEIPIPGLQTKTVLSEVAVVDLLGTGTSCIVHSSFSPADRFHPVSYVDLLGSKKPHLLQAVRNNLGGETRLEYAPSTKFYLEDAAAGRPWLTRLHFPVQVVEKTEQHDRVTGAKLVTRYRYRHGYYDGPEREFRGFALVDKWDAESFRSGPDASALDLPPVRSRTWFHTGASLHGALLEEGLAAEFHGRGTDPPLRNVLPPTSSLEEAREAARALRGKVLREEIYAEDGSAKEGEPYLITEHRYQVQRLQEKGAMRHGVFLPHPLETFETHTEREQDNPRKKQQLVLEVDEFGNVLLEAEVAFARGGGADATQGKTLTRVTKRTFEHRVGETDWYRHSVPIRETAFELMKWEPTEERLDPEDFAGFIRSLGHGVPFHDDDPEGPTRLRRIEDTLTLYTDDQQSSPLPEGELESLALPFDTYRKAFTPYLLDRIFGDRVDGGMLTAEGGYTLLPDDDDLWAPMGRTLFDAAKFYLPQQFIDPFGGTTHVVHDAAGLLLEETTDPVGNVTVVDNDYQALQPARIVDTNQNGTSLVYDPLGLLMQLARQGKGEGDDLSDPTLSFHYDLHAWSRDGTPTWSRTESKEAYGPGNTRHQIAWTYTSGLGEEVMQKVQAQSGEAPQREPDGRLVLGDVQERWIGTGRTVLDNKGNVVKQYEPYFSSTPAYEDEDDLVEWGVTPIFYYDPLGRLIRTELPNGTERRVEFDAWSQTEWDENDAIEGTDWLHERLLLDPTDPEYRAAMLALEHANTPTVTHFDPLGRPYLQVKDNGPAGLFETRTEFDLLGNPLRVVDARGVLAEERAFDMLGRPLHLLSPDSGETWTLPNCVDAPLRRWDGRGFAVRWSYDPAQRQTHVYAQAPGQAWALVEYALYGEHHPQAADENLRGQIHLHFDGAGVQHNVRFDLDGNLRDSIRQLALDPTTPPDWMLLQGTTDPAHALEEAFPLLEGETFVVRSMYDALGRLVSQHQPDGSEMRYSYHESSLLQRLEAQVPGALGWTEIVADTEYNAKGQRTRARFGQDVLTSYTYDDQTFRIRRMFSARPADKVTLQDLQFTYDPVGNIIEQRDEAQEDVYFGNTVVCAKGLYEYDALYRLVEAKGREHPGQQPGDSDLPWSSLPHPNVTNALIRYTERYLYDEVGNILEMQHLAGAGGWTRRYQYETAPGGAPASNRLLGTSLPGDPSGGPYSARYTYDVSGNMTSMPHLQGMVWDWASRLQHVSKGGGGDVYFSYAPDGQRVRRVYQHGNIRDERIYLGAYEIFRRRTSGTLQTERHTLHLQDGDKRLAMAETLTVDHGKEVQAPEARLRFQLPNHLDSVCVETDEHGAVITYEEYHPYGTTAFRAEAPGADVSAKRYRYTGMERDEETSLAYHTARYYAPWLARWTSPDPLGMVDGTNLFEYGQSKPVVLIDKRGTAIEDTWLHPSPEAPLLPPNISVDESDYIVTANVSKVLENPWARQLVDILGEQPLQLRISNVERYFSSARTKTWQLRTGLGDAAFAGGAITKSPDPEGLSGETRSYWRIDLSPSTISYLDANQLGGITWSLDIAIFHEIAHIYAQEILGYKIGTEDNIKATIMLENIYRATSDQRASHDLADLPTSQSIKNSYLLLMMRNDREGAQMLLNHLAK